jgi:outer membrane immunogenic protein
MAVAKLSGGNNVLNRFLLVTAAATALASSALAADLPARSAPPVPYVAVPVFTWTGFYVGVNAGYAFSDSARVVTTGQAAANVTTVGTGARPGLVQLDQDGFSGGGQIGYNVQFGGFVAGVEADIAYTDLQRTTTVVTTAPAVVGGAVATRNNVFRQDLGFLGTVRGRLGFAMDRALVYGTGGFAYGDVDYSGNFFGPQPANVRQFTGRRTSMETGWAAGGGIEYAMPNWNWFGSSAVTVKAEALYYDLGRRTVGVNVIPGTLGAGTGYNSRFETSGVVARAGLNFKFGTF